MAWKTEFLLQFEKMMAQLINKTTWTYNYVEGEVIFFLIWL